MCCNVLLGAWAMNDIVFQNRLRVARAEKRISQGDLAEMVGVSRQTISSIENNQFCPSARLALLVKRKNYFVYNFYFIYIPPKKHKSPEHSPSSGGLCFCFFILCGSALYPCRTAFSCGFYYCVRNGFSYPLVKGVRNNVILVQLIIAYK